MRVRRDQEKQENPERLKIDVGESDVVDINSIHPWDKNPRTLSSSPFIMKLLQRYGQQSPIQVWRKDMSIRKGNSTWVAMKKLGYKKVAVLWKDFPDVETADLYALSDNAASDQGTWDQEKRLALMQEEYISNAKPEELGLTAREFKALQLSMIKPEKLPDVDIQGEITGISQIMLIQFNTPEEMEEFKGVCGINVKHQKVVQYKVLRMKIDSAFFSAMATEVKNGNPKRCVRKSR